MRRVPFPIVLAGITTLFSGCGGSSNGDPQDQVATAMQRSMRADLTALWAAAGDLQAAAPTPPGRGWDATLDAAAIATMKAAWVRARTAYEHVEGATAPIFPDIDVAIDARYDDFLGAPGFAGDTDLFDDRGVTGMHAIERILYSDVTPQAVVDAERTLDGYVAAAFPATAAQAAEFKNQLAARLVTDAKALLDGWTPAKIEVADAFQGLIGLVNEQQEKVNKAATGEEESRYSQHTLADLRDNLVGTKTIYGLFRTWLRSKPASGALDSGAAIDDAVMSGFATLGAIYSATTGDAIPEPPASWDAGAPTPGDLATPFGMLYAAVHDAVDPSVAGSLVSKMNQGAMLLGIPGFVQE